MTDFDDKTYVAVYDQFEVFKIYDKMMMMTIMMMFQVGPGDDYELTVGGFSDTQSTLGDSITYYNNGMKFSTK